jgi:hypothetical protein
VIPRKNLAWDHYKVGESVDQPLQWATRLEKIAILGMLDLPHFGRGQHATACVKQLLAVTHGGDIWLDKLVSIDVELIAKITGLPIRGMDPAQFLDDKTREKTLAKEMKKEVWYQQRDNRDHHQEDQQYRNTTGRENLGL